jgi:lipopolysaccharide/colanic/teichoic acid biosynthesis glycosyltransferase
VATVGVAALGLMFPVIAPAIWFSCRASALHSELRVGVERRHMGSEERGARRVHDARGMPFTLFRFRTHRPSDGRLTRLGRTLQWTRLESLPLMLAVWSGHMSLVGPRPASMEFLDELQRECSPFMMRMGSVRPGLFGYAQMLGPESSNFFTSLCEKAHVEQMYRDLLARCSWKGVIGLDLSVLWRSWWRWLKPSARSASGAVTVTYPEHFQVVPGTPAEIAGEAPVYGAETEVMDDGLRVRWKPHRPGFPLRLSVEDSVLSRLCDEIHMDGEAGSLELLRGLEPIEGGTGRRDIICVELTRGLCDVGPLCDHLTPFWNALEPRAPGERLAPLMNGLLIEGLAWVGSQAVGASAGRLLAWILVDDEGVHLFIEPERVIEPTHAGRLLSQLGRMLTTRAALPNLRSDR